MTRSVTTAIIGAGFAGLGAAIRLREAGIDDLVVLERADAVGGTWRDNVYPGAGCDVPSLLYSYSFAQHPGWTRGYSRGEEILRYLQRLYDRYDLDRYVRFGSEVTGLAFDEPSGIWTVRVRGRRPVHARSVVLASGPLSDASLPDLRGIDDYPGVKIHSAHWDPDYDVSGKRVAVIGTGASAVQIVPEIVPNAAAVKVFQRTPGWVLPRLDYRTPAALRLLFATFPVTQRAARAALFLGHEAFATGLVWDSPVTTAIERLALAHLHHQVKDPWLRRQLTPDFRAGCKRMLMSSDWYPALQAPNCKLVTWPIAALSEAGIRTSDGVEHHVDAIVFATGYDVHNRGTPFPITGLRGRSLAEEWARGAYAYKSVSVSGYPNLFLTFGPNSGPGHNSALVYMEAQLGYIARAVRTIVDRDLRLLDVRADVQKRYNERIQRRLRRTTWNSGCASWYLTPSGYNPSMYPGFATQFLRQMRGLHLDDYTVAAREADTVAA